MHNGIDYNDLETRTFSMMPTWKLQDTLRDLKEQEKKGGYMSESFRKRIKTVEMILAYRQNNPSSQRPDSCCLS